MYPAIALFMFKFVLVSYFLKCNLEGKHYLAIIKISLQNMALNLTLSNCNFTNTKIFLETAE